MRPADLTDSSLRNAIEELEWLVGCDEIRNGLSNYPLSGLRDWAAKEIDALRHEVIIRQQIAKGAS